MADNDDYDIDNGEPVDPVTGKRGDRSATELDRRVGACVRHFRDDVVDLKRNEVLAVLNARFPHEPWDEARLARIERGVQRLTLTDIVNVIDAMGVSPALFWQRAGLLALPDTTENAILADPKLISKDRGSVLRFYQSLLRDPTT